MEDLIASIPVLVITVIVVAAIFWWTNNRSKKKERGLRQLAVAQGWIYEAVNLPLEWGYRLSSSEWTFESVSRSQGPSLDSGSSNVSKTVSWRSKNFQSTGQTILFGPRPSQQNNSKLETLSWGYLQSQGLSVVGMDNPALSARCLVLSSTPVDLGKLITYDMEARLLKWVGPLPIIRIDAEGVKIDPGTEFRDEPQCILDLVTLGESMVKNQEEK
jgi:hypothetical protein